MAAVIGWLYCFLWYTSILAGYACLFCPFVARYLHFQQAISLYNGYIIHLLAILSHDKVVIEKYIDYVVSNSYKHSLLVFPEGTDFTENTKKSSDNFAERNHLQKYDHVLHPRTTGFIFLTHQLLSKNSLDAVYDVTLVYPDIVPQNEKVLLSGRFPKVVKVHFARYSKSVLPKTEKGLKEFLEKRWLDKERTIKEFKATGNFLHGKILRSQRRWELYLALIFWSLLPYFTLYIFIVVGWFRSIVIAHTLFLVVLNFASGGFQNFEIALYNFKKFK
ncbi:hypothetical protein NQ317_005038 [Molorchus minor]|uniref:Acyltransferase C-terminal domain-containing protein n=1 Tax=Molorchus minor TaxID=1323400 RepID=A0ABQ9JZ11_9CUCU|nr:hypothetical protein NQ317_005038 [Molorchus minor]